MKRNNKRFIRIGMLAMTLDRTIYDKINDSLFCASSRVFFSILRETPIALWSGLNDCDPFAWTTVILGHFTPRPVSISRPRRRPSGDVKRARESCQLFWERRLLVAGGSAATLLAPEPETLEQPLPPIALYVSIYVFPGKRGIARTTRESYNLPHASLSFPSFRILILYVYYTYVERHTFIFCTCIIWKISN